MSRVAAAGVDSSATFRARIETYAASKRLPPAVVVDVGWVNGLAAIRSLGRAGVPVLAVDHQASALGFRSRYALPVVAPDPMEDEEGFIATLASVGETLGRPVPIFPTHDAPLNAIARHRDELAGRFLYPFPPWTTLERIQRKRFQLEQAELAGVPVPSTAYPGSAQEALAAAADLGYPLLVKPSNPLGFKRGFRRPAFLCRSAAELERAYGDAEPHAPMVQELIPGGDEELYTLGSYLAENGEALAIFSGRKLRQWPPGIGTCRVGEAVWVEEVVAHGLQLLRALGFHGVSQVEFKRDPRDGRYKLMEVNPRLWKWHGLASSCGVDVPRIAYRDLLGERPAPVRMSREGRKWVVTLLGGTRPVFARPPYVDAVFAVDDLQPALYQTARVIKRALS
jgi:predicted ATP-grasp superfamily ATP-dependent carboligase